MEMDLLNADPTQEEHLHKLKKLVQTPDSFFMDVMSKHSDELYTVFSHSQTPVYDNTGNLIAMPTGGRVKLTVGTSWRRKGD